jgi:hypothetical protein
MNNKEDKKFKKSIKKISKNPTINYKVWEMFVDIGFYKYVMSLTDSSEDLDTVISFIERVFDTVDVNKTIELAKKIEDMNEDEIVSESFKHVPDKDLSRYIMLLEYMSMKIGERNENS